jgi:uncharacterized membrane protein YbhN (UPF0104 family)
LFAIGASLDWGEVEARLSKVGPVLLGICILIYLPSWVLRGLRWRQLAKDLGDDVPLWPATCLATVGNMLNLVLPAKAGDLLWTHAAHVRWNVPYGRGVVGVLAGRVLDLLVLVAMGAIALASLPLGREEYGGTVLLAAGTVAIAAFLSIYLGLKRRLFRRALVGPLSRLVPLHDALVEPADQLTRDPRRVVLHGSITGVIWLNEALIAWLIANGMGLEVSAAASMFAVMIANLSKIVPITPASFGTYELAGAFALGVAGVPYEDAFAAILVEHLLKNGVNVALGLAALWWQDLPVFSADLAGVRAAWGRLKTG